MIKRFLILSLLFLGFYSSSFSQEMWGAAPSNYAGQMGLELNPASIVAAPYMWELHIFSMDVSLTNNYMYLAANSKLFKKSFKGESIEQDRLTDRYTKTPNKYAYSSTFIKYPGFIWVDKKFSIAFHVSTRIELSAAGVPYHLAKFIKEGFTYTPQQNQELTTHNANVVLINWHEAALTVGTILQNSKDAFITGAITLKYNYGMNAYYTNIESFDYNVPNDSVLIVHNLSMDVGHATPINGDGGLAATLKQRGHGFSTDIGVQYYKNRNDNFYNPCAKGKDEKPYDYKLGASIIDLGYIRYNHDAKTFKFTNENTVWTGFDTVKFDGVGYTDSLLSNQFFGNYRGSRDKFAFTLFTPTAISLQADFCFQPRLFTSINIIQRISFSKREVKRSNEISIVPRYETKRFEVSLPISVYDYFRPRLGLAFRYGAFTLGTDMLGAFLGVTNTFGADIYFEISVKHFGKCGNNKSSRGKKAKIEKCNTPGK